MQLVNELFVYGTLMQDTNSAMARFLRAHVQARGTAYLPGRLYDLGSYPGAVYDPEAESTITGQIYTLKAPEVILPVLDDYEGVSDNPGQTEEYTRIVVPAIFNGTKVSCWIYQYNFDPAELPLIPGGNYLSYYAKQLRHRQFIEKGR
jgi:gamma-glutamylcyclotransferase (GGCT)/AIG2-like uncharacterized protein YtfP